MLINVLIVEKESIIALDLKHKLESRNYIVNVTQSGEEALDIVKNNKIDLIFMAMHLHGILNGLDAAIQIRKQFSIPIIYISANSNLIKHKEIRQTRPFQYITKPFEDSQIQEAVNNCLMVIKLNEVQKKFK